MSDSASVDKLKAKNQILQLLKLQGPQTAAALAQQLQVSPMAIRQHLQTLQQEALVKYEEERRPMGRPVKLWQLTEQATQLFPDSHADVLVNLLESVEQVFGNEGLEQLLAKRAQSQIQTYTAQLPENANWQQRVATIAHLRSQEGYMAEVIPESEDVLMLVENHCSIHAAAQSCQRLCRSELEVFSALLGNEVTVERVEHIVGGDRRCAYRIGRNPAMQDEG